MQATALSQQHTSEAPDHLDSNITVSHGVPSQHGAPPHTILHHSTLSSTTCSQHSDHHNPPMGPLTVSSQSTPLHSSILTLPLFSMLSYSRPSYVTLCQRTSSQTTLCHPIPHLSTLCGSTPHQSSPYHNTVFRPVLTHMV